MNVVILGCGRMGAKTATIMREQNHNVIVIDKNINSSKRLNMNQFDDSTFIIGNGLEIETLERAHLEKADAFVATTNYDNRNIMSALIAKNIFSVPIVIARFYDSDRAEIFSKLGITPLCVTTLGSGIVHDIILGTQFKKVEEYILEKN